MLIMINNRFTKLIDRTNNIEYGIAEFLIIIQLMEINFDNVEEFYNF